MKLLISILAASKAEFGVPLDVIPDNVADCVKDGTNACIECIECTYYNYDGKDQGGTNCRAGPYGQIGPMTYWKEWCRNDVGGNNTYSQGSLNFGFDSFHFYRF